MGIEVRAALEEDPGLLAQAFKGSGPGSLEQRLASQLAQHREGRRVFLVGRVDGALAGYGSLVWQPDYPPFRERGIPEVQDLNVAPQFRRRGVASRILDEAERFASQRSASVGIAFGLHPGYRAAQRLYVLRGYVPDGHGVFRSGRFPREGELVMLDDELILHLTKELAHSG
jgi:GNAT superfamily N-acetyltransferase